MTSRWFALVFALSLTMVHAWLIGYDYWAAARHDKHFDIRPFLWQDLERPLFEKYALCGGWTHYSAGQSVDLGLDFPAYVGATLLYSAVNRSATCVDALTTPRGQIVTAVFVPPLWFVVGMSIRRLARHRWHPVLTRRASRAFISLGLVLLPLGALFLLLGFLGLFVSDGSLSARLAGLALWMFYISALSAERLRIWPFGSMP